jgi:hypothetical protein
MNARQAVQENEVIINQSFARAKRVMKVRQISLLEAIEYGRTMEMNDAITDSQKAAIDIRYDELVKMASEEEKVIYTFQEQNDDLETVKELKTSSLSEIIAACNKRKSDSSNHYLISKNQILIDKDGSEYESEYAFDFETENLSGISRDIKFLNNYQFEL